MQALTPIKAPRVELVAPNPALRYCRWWFIRWALSMLLLAGGLVILSLHSSYPGVRWAKLTVDHFIFRALLPSHFLLCGIAVTTLTSALFLGWTTIRAEASALTSHSPSERGAWAVWLVICATSIVALKALLNYNLGTGPAPLIYFLAITILAFVAVASWGLAAMPAQFWSNCFRRDPQVLPAAAVAGTLAYVGGHHLTRLVLENFDNLMVPFQQTTLTAVAISLRLFAKHIVFEPRDYLVGTQNFATFVGVPCAGWEGIGLFCTFFGIYLWFYRRDLRFPAALVLLPAGVLMLWLSNVLRITLLILLGNISPSIATEGFHSVAGWLFFDAITLTLIVISRQMRLFAKIPFASTDAKFTHALNPAAPYLVPLIVIIVTAMMTRMFSGTFDLLYPLRFLTGGAAIWFYRNRLSMSWTFSWTAVFLGLLTFTIWLAVPVGDWNITSSKAFSLGLHSLPREGQFLWILCRTLSAMTIVPIAEELAFRGYLLRKLVCTDFEIVPAGSFTWFSFLTCSALFGVLHARWLAGCVAGMIFAAALYRRGLLSDAIVSHGTANGLLAAYVLATKQWSLWN